MTPGRRAAGGRRATGGERATSAAALTAVPQDRPAAGQAAARPSPSGLALAEHLPYDAWLRIGQQLKVITDSTAWWLGDWLVYGEDTYPDRYRQAVAETGLNYQTLRNYTWVVRRFPHHRRRGRLSLQHHAEVCSLSHAEQDAWLERAEQQGWSRNELRRQLRDAGLGAVKPDQQHQLLLHVTVEQENLWRRAAELMGSDLRAWVNEVIRKAALAAFEAGPGATRTAVDPPAADPPRP